MSLKFVNGGLFTTVQDAGRYGLQKLGFHVSGVMDQIALRSANILLDLPDDEAAIEFTLMGPTIEFTEDTEAVLTGGDFQAKLNGEPMPRYQVFTAHKGDVLAMGFVTEGMWGYLAVARCLDIPTEMGSRSTDIKSCLGGLEGRKIQTGDQIAFRTEKRLSGVEYRKMDAPVYRNETTTVHVVLGPQDDYFSEKGIKTFLGTTYKVTNQCDRMGYRLEGEMIEHNEKGADIISDGIAYGSIQVPAHGQPIVMLSDRQTTGGYTKIATVVTADIPKLVQAGMNANIRFAAMSEEEAQDYVINEWDAAERIRADIDRVCNPKKSLWERILSIFKGGDK